MAARHDEYLERGARVFGISADGPGQNSAVIEKLALPFPILSDESRDLAIRPLGFADEKDPRKIARTGLVIIDTSGERIFSYTGRDYADRPDEDAVLEQLDELDLEPTTQAPPAVGTPEEGEKALTVEGLGPYFRGAKFAALALRSRHREVSDDFRDDAKAYVQMVDRYLEALSEVESRKA